MGLYQVTNIFLFQNTLCDTGVRFLWDSSCCWCTHCYCL